MSRFNTSPHTHTNYVDGKNTVDEMVRAAIGAGVVAVGFTDHAPQDFDTKYSLPAHLVSAYREDVYAAREKYGDRIRVYCGLEKDIYSAADTGWCDYWICSSHYFVPEDENSAMDISSEISRDAACRHFGGDTGRMIETYYRSLAAIVRTEKPAIVGHADLFSLTVNADAGDGRIERAEQELLLAARDAGSILEVNTKAYWRGTMTRPYPSLRILGAWREMGGQVILSSDAHVQGAFCVMYDEAREYIRSAGYREETRLGGQGEEMFVRQEI